MRITFFITFLAIIFLLNSCLATKNARIHANEELLKKAEDSIREQLVIQLYLDSIEMAKQDSLRIADSIAAIPPPVNFDTVLLASIQRTPCYGNCPHYEIRFFASGYSEYFGYANVEKLGKYETRTDSIVYFQLLQMANDIDYFNMNDFYPVNGNQITDFPMCISRIKRDSIFKIVYNRNDAPKKLIRFEQYIDELFLGLNWTKS